MISSTNRNNTAELKVLLLHFQLNGFVSKTKKDIMMFNNSGNGTNFQFDTNSLHLETFNDEIFTTYLPAVIYTAVLMMVGTPGNAIVIYIYRFKWRRCTSRVFIISLAILDFINCISTLPMEIYIMRYSVMLDIPLVCKLSRCLTYTMNSASAMILVGIAVDRFKRICKPFTPAFSVVNSKHICIGSVFISVGITWPALVLYGTREIQIGTITGKSCLVENRFDSTPYPNIYFICMGSMTIVIFTTLSVLYYFVGVQIYKRRDFKQKRCSRVEMIVEEDSTEKSENGIANAGASSNSSNDAGNYINTGIKDVASQDLPDTRTERRISEQCDDMENKKVIERKDSQHRMLDVQTCVEEVQEVRSKDKHSKASDTLGNVHNSKRRQSRVKYRLVRGSTTIMPSGRRKYSDYLTIRIGKSTLMLFLITVVYIASFLPFYILAIIRQSKGLSVQQMSRASLMAYQVSLRSYLLSSAVNPLIYSFCNAQFRGHFLNIVNHFLQWKSSVFTDR